MKAFQIFKISAAALTVCVLLCACGKTEEMSIEDEVAMALLENNVGDDLNAPDSETADSPEDKNGGDSVSISGSSSGSGSSGDLADDNSKPGVSVSGKTVGSKTDGNASSAYDAAGNVNYFLGENSSATSFNIKYSFQMDSGLAGITWGGTKPHKGIITSSQKDPESKNFFEDEFYVVAFECGSEFPMLYTCRMKDGVAYDEKYTNVDFMFPELVMFTSVENIVEIKIDGQTETVYLDSYEIAQIPLESSKPCGLIGTYVKTGNYNEYVDNLFVAEGTEGKGEWIYSDDFSGKVTLFSPSLKTENGRLNAKTGYYTVTPKED